MTALLYTTALGTALVAGIFYAFSTFIMGALGRLEPRAGIAAMQSINIVVINPLFMLAFFGSGILCVAAIVLSFVGEHGPAPSIVLAGGALYLLGCLLVTIAGNVPLNNRLAEADPDTREAAELWSLYLSRWTFWNHVRTAASLTAAAVFLFATAGA